MANPWTFTRRQVSWTLSNYITLHHGDWPDMERAECYARSALVSARAKFENASMLAGEISARVRCCGSDSYLVEDYYGMVTGVRKLEADIERERHMDLYEVIAKCNRVAKYCTSERGTDGARRLEPYEVWSERNHF